MESQRCRSTWLPIWFSRRKLYPCCFFVRASFSFVYQDSTTCMYPMLSPLKKKSLSFLCEGRCKKRFYTHPSSTTLSGAKSLVFPWKRPYTKRGERRRGGKKKSSTLFVVFLTNGSCLSLCLSHSHPRTLRAVAASQPTAEYRTGPPPLSPCPPGCLRSGLRGTNEHIHTALSGSIALLPGPM